MYKNIGQKLKNIAVALCIIGIFSAITTFIVYASHNEYGIAFKYLIIGGLSSWISYAVLYGLGELVDNSTIIKNKLILGDEEFKEWYKSRLINNIRGNNQEEINVSELPKEIKEAIKEKVMIEEEIDESTLHDYYPSIKTIPEDKKEKKYQKALEYIDGALLEFGIDILVSLGDYKDSKEQLKRACERAKTQYHLRVVLPKESKDGE